MKLVFKRLLSFFSLTALLVPSARATASLSGSRLLYPGSVVSVSTTAPAGRGRLARTTLSSTERQETLKVEVALKMRSFSELQARVAAGEQIPAAEMEAKYFPTQADHDQVVEWLKSQGLTITRTDTNRLAIFAKGSIDTLASAFQVSFGRVATNDSEVTSALTAPSVPSELSSAVLGIHGLQPHLKPRALALPGPLLQPNASFSGYTPSQILSVYNATGLNLSGSGQTIAIYALAFPKSSDLTSFWNLSSVSQSLSNVQQVSVAGGPASSPTTGYIQEVTLDTEWAGALAPGATLRIYAANENDLAGNDEILQQVYADLPSQPNLHVLNICIGGNELEIDKDYLIIEAQYMANLASAGVTVLSASGDTGAYANGVLQTTYPTSDPSVTGVGGTTLTLSGTGAVSSEAGWSSSGGGISQVFSRPSWQTGTGVPSGSYRLVPDVAAVGDPNTGALIVYSGKQTVIGGTSLATPIWAGFCALINQSRLAAGQGVLGFLNPKIYPLDGTAAFRGITSGNNGAYSAGAGYNLVTGLGVPNVTSLLQSTLASSSAPIFTGQLGNRTTTVGQPASFFATAVGGLPISYQWQREAAGSTSWSNLTDTGTYSGSATSLLVVNGSTSAMSGDQFRCVATNTYGTTTSSPVDLLTVNSTGVTTLAGWPDSAGTANGTGWAARFNSPGSVRADNLGNVYVADSGNNTIRKVTLNGVVTTVAGQAGVTGSTDGAALSATFNGPAGVAPDGQGNVYIADAGNYTIRKLSSSGQVTTFAGQAGAQAETDGTGTAARFWDPENLTIDSSGNLYVADGSGYVVRKITPAGVVTTLAGSGRKGKTDGTGTAASFGQLEGITVDGSGNVYVSDNSYNTVRKITPAGVVTTLAGNGLTSGGSSDGTGSAASFDSPTGMSVDSSGNLYVADYLNDTIRKVTPAGVVTTVTGAAGVVENIDGLLPSARFNTPTDVSLDSAGVLYVSDSSNCTIRRVVLSAIAPPVITSQPQGQSIGIGGSASLSVTATGVAPLLYQWYLNGGAISGATNSTYSVSNAQSSAAGSYVVSVSNDGGTVFSSPATLTVSVAVPVITTQPTGSSVTTGGSFSLSVVATGSGLSYQWALNGTAISGATSATYTVSNAQTSNAGTYTVVVSNSAGSVTSSSATVSVSAPVAAASSSSSGGGGGGGGAPSVWFLASLCLLTAVRLRAHLVATENRNGNA